MNDGIQDLIENYFSTGYTYPEIVHLMASDHGFTVSLRQLKRILRGRGLFRRKYFSSVEDVAAAIDEELEFNGSLLGYRLMYQRLASMYGIKTTYATVCQVLKVLDPEGVQLRIAHRLRRRQYHVRGPNDVWHIDGNDKLLPYGFAIHGAIDGYSRRVLWFEVGRSNKDPLVTASYYLKCVRELDGTALTIRFDPGTENGMTADLQQVLSSGDCRVLYGKSTANQRIESWWSFLKRVCLSWWINFLKELISTGVLDNSENIEIEAVRYFFGELLRDELKNVALQWNLHRIRQVRDSVSPAGRPQVLFHSPGLTGSEDFKYLVEAEDVDIIEDDLQLDPHPQPLCSLEAKEIIEIIMDGPKNPINAFQALDMFQLFLARLQQFYPLRHV
ncbi:hypothetical protein HOLleu_34866 [Holothuria leucospilota]|uniref:Integrase catalytic domain-containing protein n=1 Tax=Holothuria leucospilota TaxID=206669 RepID=A0A9Q0YNZ3_HOLLE|nr:hypothetical protein HOLleu_34866 [Holothuria leucospilota]